MANVIQVGLLALPFLFAAIGIAAGGHLPAVG